MAARELDQMPWRDRYELEAKREGEKYRAQSEAKLLKQVQKGKLGSYYQIWFELGRKGTLQNAALVLLEFLQQHPGDAYMLHRYHCAGALLQIITGTEVPPTAEIRRQIQWDHEGEAVRQQRILALRQTILDALAPNNTPH